MALIMEEAPGERCMKQLNAAVIKRHAADIYLDLKKLLLVQTAESYVCLRDKENTVGQTIITA